MPQKLFTKRFGELEVEHGGWQNGNTHVVRLTNGAYCFISGLPVEKKSDFAKAGMTGDELESALFWFEHRHDKDQKPARGIKFEADGTPIFDDGTPVESPSELMQYFKPGPVLDAAIKALVLKQEKATQQTAGKVDAVAREKGRRTFQKKAAATKKTGKSPGRPPAAAVAPTVAAAG